MKRRPVRLPLQYECPIQGIHDVVCCMACREGRLPRIHGRNRANSARARMAAVVVPPHCPSCRAPVTLTCPNLKEALIVCSDEAVRPVPRVPATP